MSAGYKGEGNPFSTDNPTIYEFNEQFAKCSEEISIDGKLINSHKIPTRVTVTCINNDKIYNIVGMSMDYLFGCGCPASICIEIEEEED